MDFRAPQRPPRRSDPVQLAFGRAPSLVRGAELAWLGVAALVFVAAAWQYTQLAGQRSALQATLAEADRFSQRQATQPLDASRPEARALAAEVVRANAVAARLQVPWEALFTDLELAAGEGVTLTGLEPEGGMRRLRITGEARRFEDLTQYLRRLEGTPALHNVFLTSHEQRDRGVAFTLTADWVRSDEPVRP
nr:PilN domain-containing protein [Ramlibacter cellulosilyticus]